MTPESKSEDSSIFHGMSRISRYEFEKYLRTEEGLVKLGKYSVTGKYPKPMAGPEDIKAILDMVPQDGFIEIYQAQKIAGSKQKEIDKMQSDLKPTEEINKEREKLRFFKDEFGIK